MTVQECYANIHGDYAEVSRRMMKDDRIKKFLFMFLRDETFDRLCAAMADERYEDAFREAHTLKGLCQNMAFTDFFVPVNELTECLRGGTCRSGAQDYLEMVKDKYVLIRKEIEELQNAE